jgi:hypothetical protein
MITEDSGRPPITVVQYAVELVSEGMTLAAARRVLELEARVKQLEEERARLRAALAERDQRPGLRRSQW